MEVTNNLCTCDLNNVMTELDRQVVIIARNNAHQILLLNYLFLSSSFLCTNKRDEEHIYIIYTQEMAMDHANHIYWYLTFNITI